MLLQKHWKNQLQRTGALSTTETEIMAASKGANELLWLKRLVAELNGKNSVPILDVDSASAGKNPE